MVRERDRYMLGRMISPDPNKTNDISRYKEDRKNNRLIAISNKQTQQNEFSQPI